MFVLDKMNDPKFLQSEKIPLLTKLPLIDFCLKSFPFVDFEKNLIISVQHLLTTTLSLFEALFEMGLNPSNLIVIGKCYSTDRRIFDRLVDRGVFVAPASIAFDSHMAYDEQFDQIIDQTLEIILNCYDLSKYNQITILDDGGHLIEKVHDLQLKHPRIVGIEQTSSGYNRTKHLPLSFPVINLAKAWAKTQYEPELILKHCLEEVTRFFEKIPEDSNILILGNGTLGNALYGLLKINHQIEVYDIYPERNKAKHNMLIPLLEESNMALLHK